MSHRRPKARPADAAQFHFQDGIVRGSPYDEVREHCTRRFGEPLDWERRGPMTSGDEKQRLHAERLADLLRESPALASMDDTSTHRAAGASPVHAAVQCANVHVLAVLIAAGADLNRSKNNGATPLHSAIHAYGQGSTGNPMAGPVISAEEWECRCQQCFEMLVIAGADLHKCHSSRGGDGVDLVVACTAHEHSRSDACLPFLKRLLALGCRVDSLHTIDQSLLDQSDGLRIRGATAAHWAAMNGHTRCLELLLLAGADPTVAAIFPDGRLSVFDIALDDADDANDDADDSMLSALALVAAVLKGSTTAIIRGGESLDPRLITRCKEQLRHRQQLGEKRRKDVVSAAHREHARRGLQMAHDLLDANMPHAGRLCYVDALLFVAVGGSSGGGQAGTGRDSALTGLPAPTLPAVSLDLSWFGSRDEAFEALHNLVHCEQVLASQSQTREAHFLSRQAAEELVGAFPSRALAWVAYGKTLHDIEHGVAKSEGYNTEVAVHGRQSTGEAMRRCVEMARSAPDFARHVVAIDNLARGANMSLCPQAARSYDLYCQAIRWADEDDTPAGRASQVDLLSQSLACKECGATRRLRGAVSFEVANTLQCKLSGRDDLRELATCRVIEGSALGVVTLLGSLSALMPQSACSWIVAAAKVSRSWRAAAIVSLQEAGLLDLQPTNMQAHQSVEREEEREEALAARFNLANALASSGRFTEARAAAVEVWNERLALDAADRLGTGGRRSGVGCFSHVPRSQTTWGAWADMTANGLRSGARLVGLMAQGGEPPPPVMEVECGLRDDLASALIRHAERMRERGATPAALLSTVLSARSVAGDHFSVPPLLERAIRGWAGCRGAELSGTELDDLWGQMLHDARAGRRRTETPRADAAAIAASYLEGILLPRVDREPRAVAQQSRKAGKGKAAKKGKGKGKAAGGGRRPRKEEEEEEEEEEVETPAADIDEEGGPAAVPEAVPDVSGLAERMGGLSAKEQLPDYDAECPICQETAEEVGSAFLVLPCGGRHGVCRPCAQAWQVTCVKSTT